MCTNFERGYDRMSSKYSVNWGYAAKEQNIPDLRISSWSMFNLIMTSLEAFEFDKMVVNTKLAQEYIKKNNSQIVNIVYSSDIPNKSQPPEQIRDMNYYFHLSTLAYHIQNNIDLFCQLEYLNRQKPIKTTMLELTMIVKHLFYQASLGSSKVCLWKPLVMKNDTPLIDLGWIALLGPAVDIFATEKTSVVCYLFTELCHHSGLEWVNLSFLRNEVVKVDEHCRIQKSKVLDGGCIGVVTAQSDVESAVDVFLTAPIGGLWGIRHILVQESASERFKSELAWKTRSETHVDIDPKLKSLCSDFYAYDGKLFLREYVGNDTDLRNVVLIESFRTVKELMTLIENYSPFCVSLWSHGAAESNEIAFGITAPMVWVNRYGTHGDPNQVSLAYFSQIVRSGETDPEMNKLRKLQKDWVKLPHKERRSRALDKLTTIPDDNQFMNYLLYLCTSESHTKNFVHVGASDTVIGVSKPRDVYAIHWEKDLKNAADVLHSLVNGSGFLISISDGVDDSFRKLITQLTAAGLPIHLTDFDFPPDTFPLAHTTRIVYTSFGTIFAN